MIYLFEDRKGRMAQFLFQVSISSNFKEAIFSCPESMSISEYINQQFGNASAILFHSSYTLSNKNITKENIRSEFISRGISFILFSGGMGNNYFYSDNNTIQANINSGTMYQNLHFFIDEFDKNKVINVPLLIFGQKYLKNEFISLQHLIVAYLSGKSDSTILLGDDKEYLIDMIIDPTLKGEKFTEDKRLLIKLIKESESKITAGILKSQLQKLANKYK